MEDKKILFESITGSVSYNTDIITSDIDKKFVYIQHPESILGFKYVEQINVNKDYVGYEIRRFIQLLKSGNPSLLEMLFTDDRFILHKDPVFDLLIENRHMFITKKIKNAFIGMTVQNIKKSKIKNMFDLAFVITLDGKEMPLNDFLKLNGYDINNLGLFCEDYENKSSFPLYYKKTKLYKGIVSEIGGIYSSYIPKGETPVGYLFFQGGRNVVDDNGLLVDGKSLMHAKRILDSLEELVKTGSMKVYRDNRKELIDIRNGNVDHIELIDELEKRIKRLDGEIDRLNIPDQVDEEFAHKLLIEIRNKINW